MLEFPFDISRYFAISGQSLAYFIFFIIALFTAIISAILFFHWKKYSMRNSDFFIAEIIYIAITSILLFLAFININ